MFYSSKIIKDNEHFFKLYHLTFEEEGMVQLSLNGSSFKRVNGTGGQKGGMFFWANQKGVCFWLKRFIECEKRAYESGILSAKRVPEKVYVLEFRIPKKEVFYPDWQVDLALCGNELIPLISKYYYKLFKKQLLTEKEASLYLNCPLMHDKKYSKKITGLSLSKQNFNLTLDQGNMSFLALKNNSAYFSGIIQRLHDFLYLKSKGYAKEYTYFLKKMMASKGLGSLKYCGTHHIKPVAVEVWDSQTQALLLRSEKVDLSAREMMARIDTKTVLSGSFNEKN